MGLDHFEGRKWDSLHHHITRVMAAFAFLAWKRRTLRSKAASDEAGTGAEATLPPIRAVIRALEVVRFAALLEQVLGVPRRNAEANAATILRTLGVQM